MNHDIDRTELDPARIAGLLTRAAEQLDDDTLTALKQARNTALARQRRRAPALATATGHHWAMPHNVYRWGAMAFVLLVMVAGGASYWHHAREHEMSRLDVAILTDEMPLEVFVD